MSHKNKCSCKKHKLILNVDVPIVDPLIVDPPIVDPLIVDPLIVDPLIVDPPIVIDPLVIPLVTPRRSSGIMRAEDVHTLIIYVANTYEGVNRLEGVKTDQVQMLMKLSGITGINKDDIDPSIESNKMRVIRYPNESSKSRVVLCFDNSKARLLSNLRTVSSKYPKYSNVIFIFTGHGANSTNINNLITNDNDDINLKEIINIIKGTAINIFCYLDCCRSGVLISEPSRKMELDPRRRYVIMTAAWRARSAYTSAKHGSYMMMELVKNIDALNEANANSLFIFTCLIGRNMVENQLKRGYENDVLPLRKIIEKCKILENDKNIKILQLTLKVREQLKTGWSGTLSDWIKCINSYQYFNDKELHKTNPRIEKLIPEMTELISTVCHKLPRIYLNRTALVRVHSSPTQNAFVQLTEKILCNASNNLEPSLEGSMATVIRLG